MKKIALLTSAILGISFLAACGSSGPSVDKSTPKGKISYAFEGVDRTLKNQKAYKGKNAIRPFSAFNEAKGVQDIYSQFDEERAVNEPDLEYNAPPIVQFQFLKQLYDATGDDYKLGVTYYSTITGETTYDFATGKKENAHQVYTSDIFVNIDIDDEDFITAEYGMHTVCTDDAGATHSQYFYAWLGLSYDLDKTDANFTLTLRDVDDCSAFAEDEAIVTYEYDYVNVKEGGIAEWRKAYVCTDRKVTLGGDHPDAESYFGDGMVFAGSASAFKDGKMYKTTRTEIRGGDANDDAKRHALAKTVIDDLGGNSTDIEHEAFFLKEKTENKKVVDIYNGFCRTYGIDIAASMLTCGAHIYGSQEEGVNAVAGLRIKSCVEEKEYIPEAEHIYVSDLPQLTFGRLLTNIDGYRKESTFFPKIELVDEYGNFIRNATEDDLNVDLDIGTSSIHVDMSDEVLTIANRHKLGQLKLSIRLASKPDAEPKTLIVNCSELTGVLAGWPLDLLKTKGLDSTLPAPVTHEYAAYAADPETSDGQLVFEVSVYGLAEEEISDYMTALADAGFALVKADSYTATYLFADGQHRIYNLYLSFGYSFTIRVEKALSEYQDVYSNADKAIFSELNQDVLPTEGTIFTHPNGAADVFEFYISERARNAFTDRLTNNGWQLHKDSNDDSKIYYLDSGNVRYIIGMNLDRGSSRVTFVYTTGEPQPEGKVLVFGEIVFSDGTAIPLEGYPEGVIGITYPFQTGDCFTISVHYDDDSTGTLGYSDLEINDTAAKYLSSAQNNAIEVIREGILAVTVKVVDGAPCIIFTAKGGEVTENAAYSIVGNFNNWDAQTGYNLTYDESNDSYSISLTFTEGDGFVVLEDYSWDNYLGFSNLASQYDVVAEGDTNGIVPTVDFSATVVVKDSQIYLNNIQTAGDEPTVSFTHMALVGNFNDWDVAALDHEFVEVDDVYRVKIHLTAGDEFKIVFDQSWEGCLDYESITAFQQLEAYFEAESVHNNIRAIVDCNMDIVCTLSDSGLSFTVTAA